MKTKTLILFIGLLSVQCSNSVQEKNSTINGNDLTGSWITRTSEGEVEVVEFKPDSTVHFSVFNPFALDDDPSSFGLMNNGNGKWKFNDGSLSIDMNGTHTSRKQKMSYTISELSEMNLVTSSSTEQQSNSESWTKLNPTNLGEEVSSFVAGANAENEKELNIARAERLKEICEKIPQQLEGYYSREIDNGFYTDEIRFGNGEFMANLEGAKLEFVDPVTKISGTYRIESPENLCEISLFLKGEKIGTVIWNKDYITVNIIVNTLREEYKLQATKS